MAEEMNSSDVIRKITRESKNSTIFQIQSKALHRDVRMLREICERHPERLKEL